jgi:hypothetical protein
MTRATLAGGQGRKGRFGARRGTEILELALLLGPIILLVLGGMDFGMYLYLKHNCQSAAREGARAGIVDEDIGAAVKKVMETNAGIKKYEWSSRESSDQLTVTVRLSYEPFGLFTKWGNSSLDGKMRSISSAATMRIEPDRAPLPQGSDDDDDDDD